MYNINPQGSMAESYQVGKGSNQVFDLSIGERAIERKAAQEEHKLALKQKEEAANKERVFTQLASMDGKDIMSFDIPAIHDQQRELMDYAAKNGDKLGQGDIATRLELDQRMAKLKQAIAISSDTKNRWTAAGKAYAEHKDQYLPDTGERLLAFSSAAPNSQFNEPEFMVVDHNIDKGLMDIVSDRQKTSKGVTTGVGTNNYIDRYTLPEAKKDAFNYVKANPNAQIKAAWLLNRDTQAMKDKYKPNIENPKDLDYLANYIADTKAENMVYDRSDYSQAKPDKVSEGDGQDIIIKSSETDPISYKMGTPSKSGSSDVARDVNVAYAAKLGKDINTAYTISTKTFDVDGNRVPGDLGTVKVFGSEIKVVPTYKKGTKGFVGKEGDKKEIDLGGRVIPSTEEDRAKKEGYAVYEPRFYGVASKETDESNPDGLGNVHPVKKNISINFPANELRGRLGKNGDKTLEQMNEYAKELNGNKDEVKMIKVSLNGRQGQIPESSWEAFKKKNPNATR
jgi:hypothetical protein